MFALFPAVMVEQAVVVKHKAPSHSFSFVQSCTGGTFSGTTATLNFGSSVSGSDAVLVLYLTVVQSPPTISSGTLYTSPMAYGSGGTTFVQYAYLIIGMSGASQTFTGSGGKSVIMCEVSGVNTTTRFDSGASAYWGANYCSNPTDTTCGNGITTTGSYDTVCGIVTSDGTSGTVTAGSGYNTYYYSFTSGYQPLFIDCSTAVITPSSGIKPPVSISPSNYYTVGTFALVLK